MQISVILNVILMGLPLCFLLSDKIWEYGNTPGVTGSDEAVSCGDWNGMVVIQFSGTKLMNNEITSSSMGGWTWDFNIWPKCYKVIRKVEYYIATY